MSGFRITTGASEQTPAPVIACVVVTYNPDRTHFQQLLAATAPQVSLIHIVDNGSARAALVWLRALAGPTLTLVELGSNRGVAAAQNAGIAQARRGACDHVLLLDHDSVPAPTMVRHLLDALERINAGLCHADDHEVFGPMDRHEPGRVAAVGPRYLDERQGNPPPFIRIRGLRLTRCACEHGDDVVEVDYLIASGSLIPMATLDRIGGMSEELFIDYVDIEWGLRARRRGYLSYGACAAKMTHKLGEDPILFLGRSLPLHSPLRHYYHFRNAVWLYLHADLPLVWKCADGWRLVLKYGFYTLFAKPRLEHWQMMSRGILDGLRGRLGPFGAAGVAARSTAVEP